MTHHEFPLPLRVTTDALSFRANQTESTIGATTRASNTKAGNIEQNLCTAKGSSHAGSGAHLSKLRDICHRGCGTRCRAWDDRERAVLIHDDELNPLQTVMTVIADGGQHLCLR